MDGVERIHNLIEQLSKAVSEQFPGADRIMLSVYADGYRSLTVDKLSESGKDVCLLDQVKFSDAEWTADRSEDVNEYIDNMEVKTA